MNLEKEIDQLTAQQYQDHPRVIAARERHKKFEARKPELEIQRNRLEEERVEAEKTSARSMLEGADPKLGRIAVLVSRKSEIESELNILGSVIEQSKASVKQIQAEVAHEREVETWKAVSSASDYLLKNFEPFIGALTVFEKAVDLHAIHGHWLTDHTGAVRRTYERVLEFKQGIPKTLEDLNRRNHK